MITRYQDDNVKKIWEESAVINRWLNIELLVLEAWFKLGKISQYDFENVKNKISININRWKELEREKKHEFASFLTMLEESVGDKSAKWLHFGLTSSDVLDSALMIGINETLEYTSKNLFDLFKTIHDMEIQFHDLEICGRTHGRIAEKQSFSHVLNRWKLELKRCITREEQTKEKIKIIKISGPVGNYSTVSKDVEWFVANKIGFKPALGSSQIISRDYISDFFYCFAMIASLLEKIATSIRLLSMDGIDEFNENFSGNQIGSSAMPHKRNPIICENVSGLSRMIKSYLITSIDNNNSWLERDISHSSIERITVEDASHLLNHSVKNIKNVLENLKVNYENINNNCEKFSSQLNSHSLMLEEIEKSNTLSRFQTHQQISKNFSL